ncbi:MAG TPA: glycosyltransferase family 2 protein [Terriglobia bacterium]|nr:glycosyltransferase family 2 protein [Terriglobia bacterium]
MSQPAPPVTVVMPAHSAEKWIAAAITSVLRQSYQTFELWVLENGSEDATLQIARQHQDPRVKVFELGPVGFQGALIFALNNCRSKWLARMDADDLMFLTRLEAQVQVLTAHPDYALVGSNYAILTPFGHLFEKLGPGPIRSRELTSGSFALLDDDPATRFSADPSMMFDRQAALNAGGYDPDFSVGDISLWIRMLGREKGWEMEEVLYAYRLLPASFGKTGLGEAPQLRMKYGLPVSPHYTAESNGQASGISPRGRYWRHILRYEAGTRNGRSLRRLAALLQKEGLPRLARRCRWLSYFGPLGFALYGLRYPLSCRREDWERQFNGLLREQLPD